MLDAGACRLAETRAKAGVVVEAPNGVGERLRVSGRHEQAGDAVLHELGNARDVARDHGQPGRHRLHQRDRDAFAIALRREVAGTDGHVGARQDLGHLRPRPGAQELDDIV